MDILGQAKSGMGKTAVFVLATLQQIDPVDGQVCGHACLFYVMDYCYYIILVCKLVPVSRLFCSVWKEGVCM